MAHPTHCIYAKKYPVLQERLHWSKTTTKSWTFSLSFNLVYSSPPLFIEVSVISQESARSCIIDIASVCTIFLLDFGTVPNFRQCVHFYPLHFIDALVYLLKAYKLSELIFFVYIKSCQYSMFYTNKMFWTRSQV